MSRCSYEILVPNGIKDRRRSLRCCLANGIPIMVMAHRSANIRWVMAISHQPNIIHRMLNAVGRHPYDGE